MPLAGREGAGAKAVENKGREGVKKASAQAG